MPLPPQLPGLATQCRRQLSELVQADAPAFVLAIEAAKTAHTDLELTLSDFTGQYFTGAPEAAADVLLLCLHFASLEGVAVRIVPG
jgi:hypothetical protein